VSKHNTGYRLTVLVDIASTLPVAFRLDQATADERSALTALLGDVFEGWPDAPVETISGDSLFENSKELATHLVFGWGIQPIFPERAGEFARHLRHADTLGVPKCACGEMKVRNREGFYDVARRRKHGFRPGSCSTNGARGALASAGNARLGGARTLRLAPPTTLASTRTTRGQVATGWP